MLNKGIRYTPTIRRIHCPFQYCTDAYNEYNKDSYTVKHFNLLIITSYT